MFRQWHKTIRVLEDGQLGMDNNLVENKMRPLALGRKNCLFAGSHDATQRIAMMYLFFATCKANDVNPYEWLKVTLDKMPDHPVNRLNELLLTKIAIKEKISLYVHGVFDYRVILTDDCFSSNVDAENNEPHAEISS